MRNKKNKQNYFCGCYYNITARGQLKVVDPESLIFSLHTSRSLSPFACLFLSLPQRRPATDFLPAFLFSSLSEFSPRFFDLIRQEGNNCKEEELLLFCGTIEDLL